MTTLRDDLGQYAHDDAWSGWMGWLYGKGTWNEDGSFTINADSAQRWKRQMETKYVDLPDNEKLSDLAEADKMMAIFHKYVPPFKPAYPGQYTVMDIPMDWDYDGDMYTMVHHVEYEHVELIFARPNTFNQIPVEERALIQVRFKDLEYAKGYLLDSAELLHFYQGIHQLVLRMIMDDMQKTKESTTVPE